MIEATTCNRPPTRSRVDCRFDVLLVDYDLDDGNGAELVTWLRAAGSDAKVVAVSARERGNEALVAAGANVVCAKTSFARIQTVLRDLLETPASPPRVYADFQRAHGIAA